MEFLGNDLPGLSANASTLWALDFDRRPIESDSFPPFGGDRVAVMRVVVSREMAARWRAGEGPE
jgi:hypothetical protein